MALLSGRRVVVVDVETTGWNPGEGHELIEVARVSIDSAAISETWSSFVRPERAVPEEATRIHGITQEMLDDAPESPQVAAELAEVCRNTTLVFHNAAFDLPFLTALLKRGGQAPLYNPVVDTLGLARGLFGAGSNSLQELVGRLGLPPERAHRALSDARSTARVLLALAPRWERERGVRSLDELAAASQDAIRLLARRS